MAQLFVSKIFPSRSEHPPSKYRTSQHHLNALKRIHDSFDPDFEDLGEE